MQPFVCLFLAQFLELDMFQTEVEKKKTVYVRLFFFWKSCLCEIM